MRGRTIHKWLVGALLASWLSEAAAHTGLGIGYGFMAGLLHPLLGLDHLLVLLGLGAWSGHLSGRARYAVPGGFLASLVFGALLAVSGITVSGIEMAMVWSVLATGLILTSKRSVHFPLALAVVSVIGLFQGYVHLIEVPEHVVLGSYSTGLAASHIAALLLGRVLGSYFRHPFNAGLGWLCTGAALFAFLNT